ncbi:MAG: cbb3-type cytochrome c oxidase subunit 3 [Rubricoccaceae bacterium]
MWKETIRALQTGDLAQVGLIAFVLAFVFAVAYALLMPRTKRDRAKNLPLRDDALLSDDEPASSSASLPEDR